MQRACSSVVLSNYVAVVYVCVLTIINTAHMAHCPQTHNLLPGQIKSAAPTATFSQVSSNDRNNASVLSDVFFCFFCCFVFVFFAVGIYLFSYDFRPNATETKCEVA